MSLCGVLLVACVPEADVYDVDQFTSTSGTTDIDFDALYDALGPLPDAAPPHTSIDEIFDDIEFEEWVEAIEDGEVIPWPVESEELDPPESPFLDENEAESPPWWDGLDPTELHELLDEEHDLFGEPIYTIG